MAQFESLENLAETIEIEENAVVEVIEETEVEVLDGDEEPGEEAQEDEEAQEEA